MKSMKSDDSSPLKKSISTLKSYGSIFQSRKKPEPQQSILDISLFANVAQRLRFRHDLFDYRKYISKFSLLIGLFGLCLAILDNQLAISFNQNTLENPMHSFLISFVIKICITLTTIILIILIIVYHNIELRIEMQRNNINDWKLALNARRIVKFITEIIICSFQPFPLKYEDIYSIKQYNLLSTYDGIMTVLMCLRIYLLARVLILRSTLHQDISAQSFGAINNTSLNTKFIFKSWMTLYSIYILIALIIFIFIWGSWATTVCESPFSFSDSMWFTAVTFLSIGYGDIIPLTHCGRAVAIITGALGAGCTALVVAIVSSKLELTQSEKYLHNFVQDSQLNQNLQHLSANILKYSWKLYKFKKLKSPGIKFKGILYNTRQLLHNIRRVREIRLARRQLLDSSVSIFEVNRAQADTSFLLNSMNAEIGEIEKTLQLICNKLNYK